MMVFAEMRPPVASHHGETPLRGKHVNKLIDLANGEYADTNGYRLSKEQVVKNYTDDARMTDINWNNRHHVTPSYFNKTNSPYYKVSEWPIRVSFPNHIVYPVQQYFDKDNKNKQGVMLHPQRQLDPYEENDVKGTRMPDYTKLSKERDIYGELGWIANFNIKNAKDNDKMYPTYREFFDGPKNYHNQFNNASLTNQEFFRQNAPEGSVARLPRNGSPSPRHSSVGLKTFNTSVHKRSGTIDASF